MEAARRVEKKKEELNEAKDRQNTILETAQEDHEELVASTQSRIAEPGFDLMTLSKFRAQNAIAQHQERLASKLGHQC
eukprot:scaffold234299_cov36-Prasinocladus_malaysianus.AAC.4